MDVAQIAFSGIPQPISFSQAATLTGGWSGLMTAGPSYSQVSTSGTTGGTSSPIQAASSMAGTGGQGTGTMGQPSGLGGGQQGMGTGTRSGTGGGMGLPQGGQTPAGPPAGGGSSGGGGGGSGGGGGGGLPGAQPAQALQAPAQGPVLPANGALRGHPPEIFDGHQRNTQKFVKEFTLWKMCNLWNEAMTNPFQRIALALSYIKGLQVDDWMAKESDATIQKVFGDPQANPVILPIYADNNENL